ncbi:MAG: manganese efflux pump [Lachnospiraceae bacterium]|nr:manganese efflux pump [Lachnospiraceae bacterium]
MGILELLLLGAGLSMDAFAVSICKGLSVSQMKIRHAVIAGLYFGGFQALMPFLGWLLGRQFQSLIDSIDHWVAFGLLLIIGANMIRESFGKEEGDVDASFSFRVMLPLAVATSIDALAVGITFAFLQVDIVRAMLLIGATTFLFSAAGVKIGNVFGMRYKARAELAGGVVLILLGVKILLEHLGILAF